MSSPPPTRTTSPPIQLETPAPSLPPPRLGLIVGAGAAALALLLYTFQRHGADRALLLALGLALGVTLFHARFGFTSAWRQLVSVGQGRGLQAHTLMLGVAVVLFAPILSGGIGLFGAEPSGYVAPIT
ncbi:MAG: YeeE/YedE thiosulfate transporter family protein, partial [Actinomycetota bacterium]